MLLCRRTGFFVCVQLTGILSVLLLDGWQFGCCWDVWFQLVWVLAMMVLFHGVLSVFI